LLVFTRDQPIGVGFKLMLVNKCCQKSIKDIFFLWIQIFLANLGNMKTKDVLTVLAVAGFVIAVIAAANGDCARFPGGISVNCKN
jgi:hypothetical protein